MSLSLDDARRLLGVASDADADTVRAARRRLAKSLHPDLGGDGTSMLALNQAAEMVLGELARSGCDVGTTNDTAADPSIPGWGRSSHRQRSDPTLRFDHDVASFTVEALPAEAFEALTVVTSWLGELIVDEPPYQLDVALAEPLACWCRLDLVPDAGASTVAVTIVALPDRPLPEIDAVRDVWVAALNQLGAAGFEGA